MNTVLFIARRYLFSKKSVNAINVISAISMVGVLVSSAALIIILSIFNGLESIVLSMYSSFNPDMRIEPARGKYFAPDDSLFRYLEKDPAVSMHGGILQEKVLLRYGANQVIGTLRGVSGSLAAGGEADSLVFDGSFALHSGNREAAIVGAGIQGRLGVILADTALIDVYSPKKGVVQSVNPADEFVVRSIIPAGILKAQQQLDQLIIVPLEFAREVLSEYDQLSAIEVQCTPAADMTALQKRLTSFLGEGFIVKNRMQQNPLLYKMLNAEKWAVFFILTFVLVIAAFNIIGSLTMLVIDKRKDIAVLRSLGAGAVLIRRIFFSEGMMITLIGCLGGMLLGLLVCLLQQYTGFIGMGAGDFIVDAYPVELRAWDFVTVFVTVLGISAIVSGLASRLSLRGEETLR